MKRSLDQLIKCERAAMIEPAAAPIRKLAANCNRATRVVRRLWRETAPNIGIANRKINLLGDRDIEWWWTAAHVPAGPGSALDFGNGSGPLALFAAMRGYDVTAVDLGDVRWPYKLPNLSFERGDVLELAFRDSQFDLVINCSTVEHVGLLGRYGVTERADDGDLEAMKRLLTLMKPEGLMLLTIPVGLDAVFPPLCRVYGATRLPLLLAGFALLEEVYWVKDQGNRWVPCDRETAFAFEASAGSWDPHDNVYALGCFVLQRPSAEKVNSASAHAT
jgi:SAM-dependent methyltransferase